jgi:hypothetical protein
MMTGSGVAAARAATTATHGWLYNYGSGEFYANTGGMSSDNVLTYDRF